MGYTKHNVAIRQNRARNDWEEEDKAYNYEVIRGGKDGDIFQNFLK